MSGIPVSAITQSSLDQVVTGTGGYDATRLQAEIEAQKKFLDARAEELKRQTDTARVASEAAVADTAAAAKQMAAAAKAEVDSVLKALGEVAKMDPAALLES